jgi:ADP-dependent phosphofructokinase/glucokinase
MNYKNINVNLLSIPRSRVATGLYTNWDSVVKISPNILNWVDKTKKDRPKGIVLQSIEEAAYTLYEAMTTEGKEFLISEGVYEKLKQAFPKREARIGGNGFYMGNMLLMAGLTPVVSYPSRSKRLTESSPDFNVIMDGEMKKPSQTTRLLDPDYEHIIFELDNSRHILSWDSIASEGLFDYEFLDYATTTKNIDLLLLSYAHLLLPDYKNKTDEILDMLSDEQRPRIHMEIGLGSEESMKYAMKRFSEEGYCDSWGMNEEECRRYLKAGSLKVEDLKESALNAIKEYNVGRICVHTPDFAFVVSKYDITKEYRALVTASLYAAARTFGELKLEQAKNLPTIGEPVKEKIEKYSFCMVPCLINKFPQVMTGIGDGFSAIQSAKILG